MKKYKLIKEYPGSPELGTILEDPRIESTTIGNNEAVHELDKGKLFKEFWQEVVEKDYEILSVKVKPASLLYTKDENGYFSRFDTINSNKYLLEELIYSIHSVKRKSDGEVFTVGDKIRHNNNVTYPEGIITKLHIVLNVIFVETNDRKKGFDTNICLVHKIENPLFTTENGVDMIESDEFWYLNKNLRFKPECSKYYLADSKVLYFSTKKAAEEYFLMNKPCLSINDVLESIPKLSHRLLTNLIINVKSKL